MQRAVSSLFSFFARHRQPTKKKPTVTKKMTEYKQEQAATSNLLKTCKEENVNLPQVGVRQDLNRYRVEPHPWRSTHLAKF